MRTTPANPMSARNIALGLLLAASLILPPLVHAGHAMGSGPRAQVSAVR
jgi:hypothetical protein